jgi:hypothetical protein
MQHDLSDLGSWPEVMTPDISPLSAADPHAAVFIRTFELKESVLLRLVF